MTKVKDFLSFTARNGARIRTHLARTHSIRSKLMQTVHQQAFWLNQFSMATQSRSFNLLEKQQMIIITRLFMVRLKRVFVKLNALSTRTINEFNDFRRDFAGIFFHTQIYTQIIEIQVWILIPFGSYSFITTFWTNWSFSCDFIWHLLDWNWK